MQAESEMINSRLNEYSETKKGPDIKNLELLDYYAHKMNEIYNYTSYNFFTNKDSKTVVNAERWKMLRTLAILIIYTCILFIKPGWCTFNENMKDDCTETHGLEDGRTNFFVIAPFKYIDLINFEMVSWTLMLVLIMYDLMLVEINPRLIFIYCSLFIADVITCLLFLRRITIYKFNIIFRILFVIIFTSNKQQIYADRSLHFRQFLMARKKAYLIVLFHSCLFGNVFTRFIFW